MYKMRKGLAVTAAVCLLPVTLFGCSSGGKDGSSSPASATGEQTTGKTNDTGKSKEPEKVYIYASGAMSNASKLSKPEDYELVRKTIIEKSGIEIVPIIPPKGQEAEKLNLLLASNEPLDIFMGDTINYRTNGAIQPVGELLDKYGANVKKLWPQEWGDSWKALTDKDGKIWGVPSVPGLAMKAAFVRSDWMNELKLQLPTTFDEYEAVLKALKERDPAGNGQTIPMITNLVGLNLGLAAGFMGVGYGPFVDTDGKVKPPVMHPGYKQFIEKMADWYKKGYIYKESFALNTERIRELVKQNRVGTAVVHDTIVLAVQHELQKNVPAAEYKVAGELKGPLGSVMTMTDASSTGWVVSKKSQNPEAAMRLLDWINADIENFFLLYAGIKDRNWKYVDEKNRVIENLNQDYVGEFLVGDTFAYTVQYAMSDPAAKPEFDYLGQYSGDTTRSKKTAVSNVTFKFDQKEIADKLPNRADLERMIDEEIVKFIMGARPMDGYDKFLQELNGAGLAKWIDVYTEQYNKFK
ncbi:hypothetical protein DQG23_12425 [Paenibacillus contaminans]|uniref:ABC transporter substrate-binding protein n=2 Tax=Paenibacillus contaminans TaxID=450362 RepID=A0A329MMP6_9BACL|nr:hypothetical protein DQG23_12425 [Paenibacillus contaminans]